MRQALARRIASFHLLPSKNLIRSEACTWHIKSFLFVRMGSIFLNQSRIVFLHCQVSPCRYAYECIHRPPSGRPSSWMETLESTRRNEHYLSEDLPLAALRDLTNVTRAHQAQRQHSPLGPSARREISRAAHGRDGGRVRNRQRQQERGHQVIDAPIID